jgi:hypothetical protein
MLQCPIEGFEHWFCCPGWESCIGGGCHFIEVQP